MVALVLVSFPDITKDQLSYSTFTYYTKSMTTPSDVPLEELRLQQFIQSVANNPAEILARFDQIQQ